jgi:hypothetical protein
MIPSISAKICRWPAAILLLFLPGLAAGQTATETLDQDKSAIPGTEIGSDFTMSLSSGASYSSGKYGTGEKTEIWVVPFSLRLRTGPLRLTATLPYLRLDSPGNVIAGVGGAPIIVDPNASATRIVRDGLGDLSLGAAYSLPSSVLGPLDIDIGGRVKLPTSSRHKGLTTGKTDFTVYTEFSYAIDTWAPYLNVGYRFFGDPEGINLRNGFSASLGTTKQFGRLVAIASYDYSQATTSAIKDSHELFAALSGPLTGSLNWTGYGIVGLSKGSPDFGLGLLLTARLF